VKNLAFFLLWCALLIYTSLHHESWRDEGEFWLMAQRGSWHDILESGRYSGHPALWSLMLAVLAKSGLPVISQTIFHHILAVAAAFIFLYRAPFPLWLRVGILFSLHLSYEYGVIVRNYVLFELILFALCALYPSRLKYPAYYALLLALLFQTSIIAWPAACMLALFLFVDLRQRLKEPTTIFGLTCIVLSGLYGAYQVIPASDQSLYVQSMSSFQWFENIFFAYRGLGEAFFPVQQFFHLLGGPLYMARQPTLEFEPLTHNWFPGLSLLFFLMCMNQLKPYGRARWFMALTFLGVVVIFIFIRLPSFRHVIALPLCLIAAYWLWPEEIVRKTTRPQRVLLTMSLVYSVIMGALQHVYDWRYNFSGSKDMAEYLEQQHPGERIVTDLCSDASALFMYLTPERPLLMLSYKMNKPYLRWDPPMYGCLEEQKLGTGLKKFYKAYEKGEVDNRTIFITWSKLQLDRFRGFTLLYASPGLRESFYAYTYSGKPTK
jgi:hypothetical protein